MTRCNVCYGDKHPCGFMDCPRCGRQAAEKDVEDHGHCEDCKTAEKRRDRAVEIVERLAVAHAWLLEALVEMAEWGGVEEDDAASMFQSLVDARLKVWDAIRRFADAYCLYTDTADISLIEGAANAHLATLKDTYEDLDTILDRVVATSSSWYVGLHTGVPTAENAIKAGGKPVRIRLTDQDNLPHLAELAERPLREIKDIRHGGDLVVMQTPSGTRFSINLREFVKEWAKTQPPSSKAEKGASDG